MLRNLAVQSVSLEGFQERALRIPLNQGITSVTAMMLAADRIADECNGRQPELGDTLYRKYLGVSEEWLWSHGVSEAEEVHRDARLG